MKKKIVCLMLGLLLLTGCGKTIDEKNEGKNEERLQGRKEGSNKQINIERNI